MSKKMVTIDGNTAAAHVAYAFSEVAAIFPITPSSNMGEMADEWASMGKKNLFDQTIDVVEMQSEAGAAGAVHGSLVAGALTTTFTASQGLLLMIPNMYKIAGEMLPTVFHVSARSLAAQALSIFGDHSDVMSVRNTGFAMLASGSVQETMDLSLVAHLATLKGKIPFLSFFDGFRTSHEIQKVEEISYDEIASLVEPEYIEDFKKRGFTPDAPTIRVAAQNPDVYFQGRETVNQFYKDLPEIVQEYMDKVSAMTGRKINLFDYFGAEDAEEIIIVMGSGADVTEETVKYLNKNEGRKVGVLKVRLYRPFSAKHFIGALPKSVKKIAVLDRTKEPGAPGEPLYMDVKSVLSDTDIEIIGGRYGLSSKEYTPAMVKAVFDHLASGGFHDFTVGITDDVTNLSIPVGENFSIEPEDVVSCQFWGLGSDGTVGANKNSIKIIGNNTDKNAQAYFVYDSKKSGGITISHLRFGDSHVNYPYLITGADFVACSQPSYIGKYDMLGTIKDGGVFLLNSEIETSEVFDHLTKEMQEQIIAKNIRFYNINALKIANEVGLGKRVNTVMQAAFFKISGILPEEESIKLIKTSIEKAYSKKGMDIVEMNWAAVDKASAALEEVKIPSTITKSYEATTILRGELDKFASTIIEPVAKLKGDDVPVSAMSFDGVVPSATAKIEKRGVAPYVPTWESSTCIQCNQCVMSCPHAAIRAKQIVPSALENAPESFNTVKSKTKNDRDLQYRIQVYTEDCTGCGVCVDVCPTKPKSLAWDSLTNQLEVGQAKNVEYFEDLEDNILDGATGIKGVQFKTPLFEFSGACAGCGETPYIKLVTQLFGERMIIANATGCSSIYGATFPTIPYTKSKKGKGPAFGNSLFEDNAEYGCGMRLAVDSNRNLLKYSVEKILKLGTTSELTEALNKGLELWDAKTDEAIDHNDVIKTLIPAAIETASGEALTTLKKIKELQDNFVDKSVWIIGGDGWAYDIGFGGLDHVMSINKNVNILVVDTEVYSNTGGQASKSTPIAAVAKFANGGMATTKKKLSLMAMSYGNVYVASISMGANRAQAQKAFQEAEAWDGPSLIIAYAPCIAHGIDMSKTSSTMKEAVQSGYWPLFRYNPALETPYIWETPEAKMDFQDFLKKERRYTALNKTNPAHAKELFELAEKDSKERLDFFKNFATTANK